MVLKHDNGISEVGALDKELSDVPAFSHEQAQLLSAAFSGTLLAGGLFPVVLVFSTPRRAISNLVEAVQFIAWGSVYGIGLAMGVSGVLTLLLGIVLWATRLDGRRVWLASMIG